MKNVILYGAGQRGKYYASVLYEHGIEIAGFCDSYKTGNVVVEWEGGEIYKPIFNMGDIDCKKYSVIIAIADNKHFEEVRKKVAEHKIDIITLEQILFKGKNSIEANRDFIAESHINRMNEYFELAEKEEYLEVFWGKHSLFYELFQKLNLERVVELACGRGRHVQKYIMYAQNIVLVDILEKNINFCKKRYKSESKVQYYVNNGYDLSHIPTNSCTALFTYDAMVHFEMLDIFQYLKETKRILVKGGKALFHHSNNTEDYRVTFSTGKHGRNYMNKQLFAYLANRAGLTVIEQYEIDWGGEKKLDCITLVEN